MRRLIIPHVGILRFIPELGRKFLVAGVDPRNIASQQRIITLSPGRNRPEHDLEKTRDVPRGGTPKSARHAVSGGRGVTFVLVDLRDRHRNLRWREEKI